MIVFNSLMHLIVLALFLFKICKFSFYREKVIPGLILVQLLLATLLQLPQLPLATPACGWEDCLSVFWCSWRKDVKLAQALLVAWVWT